MSDPEQPINPYEAPEFYAEKATHEYELRSMACPRCQNTDVQPTPYSGWYGRRAPKAIQDVVCEKCGANFNGETGVEYPPRKSPIVWFLIALAVFLAYLFTALAIG